MTAVGPPTANVQSLQPPSPARLKGSRLSTSDAQQLPLFHAPQQTRRRWWVPLAVSKVDHTFPNFTATPDGFFLGSLSDEDFSSWISNAPSLVQDAVVCGVTWWRAKKSPLHHQFTVLTIALRANEKAPMTLYDLRMERIGKGIGLRGTAEHRITSSYAKRFDHYLDTNDIMFGMLGIDELELSAVDKPGLVHIAPAFVDVLDSKWRGPPATLRHVARYVEAIVKLAPRYKLSSTNCYYFARLIVYMIGLRHYAFTSLAADTAEKLEVRHKLHDPSAISTLFRFLHEDEKSNGVLLYGRVKSLFTVLILIIPTAAVWGGAIYFWVKHRQNLAIAVLLGGSVVNFLLQNLLFAIVRAVLIESSRHALRRDVEYLVATLDADRTLTRPRAGRGDYKLPQFLVSKTRTEYNRNYSREGPSYYETKVQYWEPRPGPRDPVLPWPRSEQIYRPSNVYNKL